MLHVTENTLTRLVNYEKTISDKKQYDKCDMKKPSNILISKKSYGLKILQNIIYVILLFFFTLKDIKQAQSRTNH